MHQEGVEPPTYGSEDRERDDVTTIGSNTLRLVSNSGCTNGCTGGGESSITVDTASPAGLMPTDPDFARVAAAWMMLSAPLKAAILALIDSQSHQLK